MTSTPEVGVVIDRVVAAVADLAGLLAVSLGGSTQSDLFDDESDIDLHVYWQPPLADDSIRAERLAQVADAGCVVAGVTCWGLEDHLRIGGRAIELIYVELDELQAQIDQAYGPGLNGEGYTTAMLYVLAEGHIVHDPSGVATAPRARLWAEFPAPTRRLLLQHNPDLLRIYFKHLQLAQRRGDLLSVQHRRYTVQMVYFNLLFALNELYHPGEKRLLIHGERCPLRPPNLSARWKEVARLAADDPALANMVAALIDDLLVLVAQAKAAPDPLRS